MIANSVAEGTASALNYYRVYICVELSNIIKTLSNTRKCLFLFLYNTQVLFRICESIHSHSVNKYSNFEWRQLATAGVDRTMNWYLHKRPIASMEPTHVPIVSRIFVNCCEVMRRDGERGPTSIIILQHHPPHKASRHVLFKVDVKSALLRGCPTCTDFIKGAIIFARQRAGRNISSIR